MVTISLVEPDPAWAEHFAEIGSALRYALADRAVAIHHIGSTAVPGLLAKPVIDVQVTVNDFVERLELDLERVGFGWRPDNDDRRKWFFKRGLPFESNCHVRMIGCPSQSQALLFRDYLRADAPARERYAATKLALAGREWDTVDDYADAKGDTVWALLREADRWSWSGWRSPPTDA